MSFNRSGYIGRAPGDSSIVLAKQYFQPTGAGRTFTFTSGYDPGLIDVYRNGVKLINVLDYAATDGSTVVLDTPVGVGSTVQIVAYKGFNVTEVSSSAGDFSVGTNLYVQSGFGSFSQGITANQINVTGIGTIGIGSFTDINVSGGATVEGTLVAGSFSGDGSALTGVGQTLNVRTESLTVAGVSTLTGVVNVDATTDSTSVTTGALIVDGGVGIAKNVYIGAGLSVAGTLTYEDVTSVDSVGLITAKSGVNITGGQLQVGVAYSVGSAGVATALGFVAGTSGLSGTLQTAAQTNITSLGTLTGLTVSGDATLTGDSYSVVWDKSDNALEFGDNAKIKVGSGDDLNIYHDGNSYITNAVANQLAIQSDDLKLRSYTGTEKYLTGTVNEGVEIYYNDSKKFETTNDGVVITGIATATVGLVGSNNGSSNMDLKLVSGSTWGIRSRPSSGENSYGFEIYKGSAGTDRKLTITSDGEILQGISTARGNFADNTTGVDYIRQIEGTSATTSTISLVRNSADANDGGIVLGKSRGATVLKSDAVLKSDDLGTITWAGADGTSLQFGAEITAKVATNAANDALATDLIFYTNGGGTSTTERLRIGSTGISTFSTTPHDDLGSLRSVPLNTQGGAYTLVASDAGKAVLASGAITIADGVFSPGDVVTIINNTNGDLAINKGSVLYYTADGTSANRTLATRGMASVYFSHNTTGYIGGSGLS